jgi:hypothetical protein
MLFETPAEGAATTIIISDRAVRYALAKVSWTDEIDSSVAHCDRSYQLSQDHVHICQSAAGA